jgi:hypothetical protein
MHQVICFFSNKGNIMVFGKIPVYQSGINQQDFLSIFNGMRVVENQSDYILGKLASIDFNDRRVAFQIFNMTVSGAPVEGTLGYGIITNLVDISSWFLIE